MTQRYIDLAFDDTSPRSFGGFNNENEATVIRLKVLDPDAKYYIEIEQACGKHDKYCSDVLPVDDGYAVFEVSRDFTHETLYVQGVMKVDGMCRKTARVRVGFSHSINALDELPESHPSWADSVDKRLNELEQSSVIPDWNQNDEAARDYIKNRPGGYYKEVSVEDVAHGGFMYDSSPAVVGWFRRFENLQNYTADILTLSEKLFYINGTVTYSQVELPKRYAPAGYLGDSEMPVYGNLHLVSSDLEDTGEYYLFAVDQIGDVYSNCNTSDEHFNIVNDAVVEEVELSYSVLVKQTVPFESDFIPIAKAGKIGGVRPINIEQYNGEVTSYPLMSSGDNIGAATPNWNENRVDCPSYIENRPGGYDIQQEIKIIDAVYTLTQSDNNQQVVKSFDFYSNGLNEEYDNVILLDGNGQNVLPRRRYGNYIIDETGGAGYGNLNLLHSRYADTGEKYFIAYAEYSLIICYKDNEMNYGDDVSVTVNVIKDVPVVFDNKYIPKASNQQYGGVKVNVKQRKAGSELVNMDENGFLYTGQTLPTNGSNARYCVPIVSYISSDDVLTYSLWPVLGALRPVLANAMRHYGDLNTETHEALFILNKESTVGTYVLEITFKVGAVNKSVKSMKVNIDWQGSKETSCAYFYCKALSLCSVLCILFYKDTVTWEIIDNNIIEDFNAYLAVVDSVQLTCGNNNSHSALTKIIKCVDKKNMIDASGQIVAKGTWHKLKKKQKRRRTGFVCCHVRG